MAPQPAPGYIKHPGHKIVIAAQDDELRALMEGHEIARSTRALRLAEAGYPERVYFPREDVDASRLVESDRSSFCPFKGTARYWHLRRADGSLEENAAWAYDTPFLESEAIAGFIAFYSGKVSHKLPQGGDDQ